MSPYEIRLNVGDDPSEELFDLDVHEVTVVAPVTSANTVSCNDSCHCPTSSPQGGC